ncbi:MAG: hypothetical protein ACTSVD_06785 [Candidatus Thorarchaeota archaeon]
MKAIVCVEVSEEIVAAVKRWLKASGIDADKDGVVFAVETLLRKLVEKLPEILDKNIMLSSPKREPTRLIDTFYNILVDTLTVADTGITVMDAVHHAKAELIDAAAQHRDGLAYEKE